MIRSIEELPRALCAPITILELDSTDENLETAYLSEPALATDWDRPEEEAAWFHLRELKGVWPMTKQQVSVCFADITHWLKLTRAVGDERAVEVLQELLKGAGDVILKHGGTIRKYIGDAVLFTFPTPQQAVNAAREMVQHRREVEGVDLRFHVAIATGEVVVTQIGHPSFLLEDVMGDTVNRAALLLREAGKTEAGVAMCEETAQAVGVVK